MRFEFATAQRIVFGPGILKQVGTLAAEMGRRALVLTGWTMDRTSVLVHVSGAQGIAAITLLVSGEPTTDMMRDGVASGAGRGVRCGNRFRRRQRPRRGKASQSMLANGGDPLDYLEVIGKGQPLMRPAVPSSPSPPPRAPAPRSTRNAVLARPNTT